MFCPTPIITRVLWGGRNKNLQVSMIFQLKNHENKISLNEVFSGTPFIYVKIGYSFIGHVHPEQCHVLDTKDKVTLVNACYYPL